LLSFLAVEASRSHSREKLAGLLWPERSDQDATANLRYALSNLRQAIGDRETSPPFLLITRQTLQFNSASDACVDVAALAELLASPEPGLDDLERAVALYHGEFLEGLFVANSAAFEEWALLKREQLARQVRSALHRLAAMHEQRGEYDRALPHAWRQVELDPWDEHAWRQLMRLLALSGQRASAITQYETLRRTLADELGVEPARATTAMYEQIRGGEGGPVEEEGHRPVIEAATAPPSASPAAARRSLSRRSRLALAGGSLAALAVAVVLLLLASENTPFEEGVSPTPTPLPPAGVALGTGKLVYMCGEPSEEHDSTLLPQICVIDYQAGRRIQVTDDLAFKRISCLAWSPDGEQIAFSADTPRRSNKLYVINADGSSLRQLTYGEMPHTEPAWSPDGAWIVFTHGDALWLIRPDGSEGHALHEAERFHLSRAAWSPDSQRIAFLRMPIQPQPSLVEVWIVNRDGSDPRPIHTLERSKDEGIFASWSPDGQQVACFILRSDGSSGLLINPNGSGQVQAMEGVPDSWLPDYWPLWGEEL
jgi:DNA-binding SARP family transcriptional activator